MNLLKTNESHHKMSSNEENNPESDSEDHSEYEEHEEHIDERWLVSYADMMTLLFGLFVLLYSMKSPEEIKKMQESIQQKFSHNDSSRGDNLQLKTEIANLKKMLDKKNVDEDTERMIASLQEQELELEKIKNELVAKEKIMAEKDKSIEELQNQNDELKNKLSSYKNFFALIVNWSTPDHDIDLSITDPAGHIFDFKRRSYAEVPGSFALDTRRGPGTEVWQADDLMAGEYKALVKFYSQYGNTQNAKVKLTIFSPRGKYEVPEFEMDYKSSRIKTILFTVDEEGRVNLK